MLADSSPHVEAAGGYGPPGGGGYGPPPGGGGYGGPPGGGGGGDGGGYGNPPGGAPPGYGGPGYDPRGGGFGPPGFDAAGFGPGGAPMQKVHPLAIVSLVMGILSLPLCCCSLLGAWAPVAAIVCGIIGINKIKAEPALFRGHGLCVAGIATGCVGLALIALGMMWSVGNSLKNQYGHF